MSDNFQKFGKQVARNVRNDVLDDRVASPLAKKVGGCATIFFILLFSALGIFVTVLISRGGGDADKAGPVALGVGIVVGIVVGALVGNLVGKIIRKLIS
jgi:hypothetical protein